MRLALCIAWLCASCGDNAAHPDAAPLDALDIDAAVRPVGALDGVCTGQAGGPRVLVYTYENQWRHESNLVARQALLDMCTTRGFNMSSSNDPHIFNALQLAAFDVVIFSVTSGSGIDALGKQDFEAWVRAGGGVLGFEAATSTEQNWPFYVQNMGAEFANHPPALYAGTVRFTPVDHPITQGLADIDIVEQWYVFKSPPEQVPGLTVLMTLDESTLPPDFPPALKVGYHAYGWTLEKFGGRVFYTALGDNPDTFADPTVLEMTARAIEWAAHRR
jgi:type 1 glutamine amidotransferase